MGAKFKVTSVDLVILSDVTSSKQTHLLHIILCHNFMLYRTQVKHCSIRANSISLKLAKFYVTHERKVRELFSYLLCRVRGGHLLACRKSDRD